MWRASVIAYDPCVWPQEKVGFYATKSDRKAQRDHDRHIIPWCDCDLFLSTQTTPGERRRLRDAIREAQQYTDFDLYLRVCNSIPRHLVLRLNKKLAHWRSREQAEMGGWRRKRGTQIRVRDEIVDPGRV